MTGYFARLAARTGVGEAAPAARGENTPPLVTEDVVSFVTQPEDQAAAPTAPSPEPGPAPAPRPTRPADMAPPAPPQFAMPDTPEAAPTLTPDSPASTPTRRASERSIDEISDPHRVADEPARDRQPALPESPRNEERHLIEAETRIARSAIAVPATPDAVPLHGVTPVPEPQPLLRTDLPPEPAARASQSVAIERLVEPVATSLRPADLDIQPARPHQPQFIAPHEPATSKPANGHSQPRPHVAPSVRIGHIQVDVHAAPIQQPQQVQPAPPVPSPPRAPSLRRFYLRDW